MCHLVRFRPFVALVLLVSLTAVLAGPAGAQERTAREYDEIIEKLELGISALKELGRGDAQEQLMRVADEVRRERDRAGARRESEARERENDEIREVRRRLAVMRYAVEVLVEADRIDAAELVERAMHAREVAIEGRRDAEAQRIREAAPNRAQLAEVLQYASKLQAERKRGEKSKALSDLSKVYLDQWRRRQRAERGDGGRRAPTDLSDRGARVDVLRLARNAHAKAGDERLARLLESAVEIGELQLAGADGKKVAAVLAAAGPEFTIGMVIESLQSGSALYREWGQPDRAARLNGLAEYYARRERERGAGGEAGAGELRDADRPDADVRRLVERLDRLEAELEKVRSELHALEQRRRGAR